MKLQNKRVIQVLPALLTRSLARLTVLAVARSQAKVLTLLLAYAAAPMDARADLKPELPTLSLGARGYWATSKSGLAESNDTGLIYKYGLSVYSGDGKDVSVHIEGLKSAISYSLNNASSSQDELNFLVRYYLGFVYLGAFGGSIQVGASRADGATLDIFASQYGGNIGALLTITRGAYLEFDLRYGVPLDIKEASQQTVTLGSKIDAQCTVVFDLTRRFLDLEAGFLYSTYDATFNGSGTGENLTAPFIGLLMSTYF